MAEGEVANMLLEEAHILDHLEKPDHQQQIQIPQVHFCHHYTKLEVELDQKQEWVLWVWVPIHQYRIFLKY